MEILYELMEQFPCHVLRGNREEYMTEQRKVREQEEEEKYWIANSASGNLLCTYEQLTPKDLDFLKIFLLRSVMKRKGILRSSAVMVPLSIQGNYFSLTVSGQKKF